ncbi:hypothetical protein C4572_02900 [Candidatus Parcubacteria bacterium]|nr:MAG: hypothetical protein C4572_02900 [Candidatus Parcubacteria bacterium]
MSFVQEIKTRLFFLTRKNFVKDAFVLQMAGLVSTGFSILGSIIYARALGVEGYAIYALIFTFVSIAGIFTNIGTNQTVLTLLPEAYARQDRSKILDILTYYVKVSLVISLLVGVFFVILGPYLTATLYNDSNIGKLARIIIFGEIINIFFGMYVIILQAIRRIKNLAVVENINKFVFVLIPAGLVLLGYGLGGLVYGYLFVTVGFLVFTFFSYRLIAKEDSLLPSWNEILKNMFKLDKDVFVYHLKFGILIAIDKNLGSLYSILPISILGMYNLEQVAFLKIATSYAALPSVFISKPVSRLLAVQLPKSKSYSYSILKRDYLRSSVASCAITSLAALLFIVLVPFLIPYIYGKQYLPAVFFSYFLLFARMINDLGVGAGPLFRTMNLMRKSIKLNAIMVTLGTVILFYFIKNYPINISIIPIAFWFSVVTLVFFFSGLRELNKKIKIEQLTNN